MWRDTHAEELVHERLYGVEVERASLTVGIHVLFQILVAELNAQPKVICQYAMGWPEQGTRADGPRR